MAAGRAGGPLTQLRPYELDPTYDVVDFLASGASADLSTCDREPIHLSEAIQPHGVLFAVREADWNVRRVSANTRSVLGVDASDILGQPLVGALGAEPFVRLQKMVESPSLSGDDPLICHMPNDVAYELTWHRAERLVVVELEPSDAQGNLSMSVLFADVRQAMQALEAAEGLDALCDVAATEVKHLTGYDRVMVYRFHEDDHGEVVAEGREPGQESFLGLNYPASDIPRQARKLYLLNHLRLIADVGYEPVEILSAPGVGDGPLNLSRSGLRSVSPFHLDYLTNMGVGATLTISLMHGTRLWGMLACHHRRPKRIDAQLRAACRLLGQMFSLQVVAHENQERHAYRTRLAEVEVQIVARLSGAEALAGALVASLPSPLLLTAADGMVARLDGQTVTAGSVPPARAVEALLARLCAEEDPAAMVCDDLPHRFGELAPFAEHAGGVLALPLSAAYEDFIFWFRGEVVHDMLWAGNPDKLVAEAVTIDLGGASGQPSAVLSPRRSFETWAQEVRGHCRPWLAAEVDAARALAASIPELLLARARDRLAHQALHDPLTSLPNRALLLDRTAQALARQQRSGGHVALLFIDLDRFKLVNDSLGHAAGDNLLLQAAQRLDLAIRDTDTAARIGGDEFVVLCEHITPAQAEQVSDRIVRAFRTPFVLDGREALVTTSIGVAVAESGTTPAELLRDADTAMYRAKHSGRNATASFTHEMRAISLRRVEIETSLRPAIERRELRLHYQPIHDTAGALTGFEALARWPLTGRGMVSPSEFVPVAESTGLVGALSEWALDVGLEALAEWRRRRPELNLILAVNIAASQMVDDALQRTIDATLQRHQLPPAALCIEITEGALVTDDARNLRFLRRLREQGVRLSIDDFGTGFSSLAYLTKLPVHELKIDRAFIAGLPANHADVAVVASVVGLAHQLGLQVLAEGVETDEQLATTRRLGCDLIQGYLLGRPMPADEIDRFLAGVAVPG